VTDRESRAWSRLLWAVAGVLVAVVAGVGWLVWYYLEAFGLR